MQAYEAQRDAHLVYELRSLSRAATVLHIGTHPDDEETGLLTYLTRGLGVRAVYWSATRGEGGQNRIGHERDEALGVIRTWESLSACDVDGAEMLYGPFYDFGFSKTGEDTLERWGREDIVREIVRAIRFVMPDVVVARWSGVRGDGHGQHQAIGMVAEEAFDAAADPTRFPELLREDLVPWQAQKLYYSLAGDWQPGESEAFGKRNADHERNGFLRINTGAYDPVAGRSYQEQAAMAWNRHRTQALAFVPARGNFFLYYRLAKSLVEVTSPASGFFDGLDPALAGIATASAAPPVEVRSLVADAQHHAEAAAGAFHPDAREKAAASVLEGLGALRRAYEIVDARPSDHPLGALRRRLARKIQAFEAVAGRLLGIEFECLLDRARATPGEVVHVSARIWNKGGTPVDGVDLRLSVPDGWAAESVDARPDDAAALDAGAMRTEVFDVVVAHDAPFTTPYWFRRARGPYGYEWPDDAPSGLPFDEPLVVARCRLALGSEVVELAAPAVAREGFAGGYRELPLTVLPPIAIELKQRRVLLPAGTEQTLELDTTIRCTRTGGARGTVKLEIPEGWVAEPSEWQLVFDHAKEAQRVSTHVKIPADARGRSELRYWVSTEGIAYSVVLDPVRQVAAGLPGPATEANCVAETFISSPAVVTVHSAEVRFVRSLRYGYVGGLADGIPETLAGFGVDLKMLSEQDLAFGDLRDFDTLIVGPHAYLLRPEVRKNAARLLDYVSSGGTLVVQFQGYEYEAGGFAPFPFRYARPHDRVTLPNAPVRILDGGHSALTSPNTIGEEDFDGWVHDRGLYFFGEWDRRYLSLLSSNDPGEEPKGGGLLVANYGRGTYVYAAYSFFRQIPVGVEGAISLFANLIGLPQARILERVARVGSIPLFSFMADDDLYRVAQLLSERWLDDGTYLSKQGERGTELYLVLEGEIEIIKGGRQWRVQARAGSGEVVGELAVLEDLPRSASLRARGNTKVLVMRGRDFRALLQEHSRLSDGVIRMLTRRLAERDDLTTISPSD